MCRRLLNFQFFMFRKQLAHHQSKQSDGESVGNHAQSNCRIASNTQHELSSAIRLCFSPSLPPPSLLSSHTTQMAFDEKDGVFGDVRRLQTLRFSQPLHKLIQF